MDGQDPAQPSACRPHERSEHHLRLRWRGGSQVPPVRLRTGALRGEEPATPRRLYDDGTNAFCRNLRESLRWQGEAFSFLETSYAGYERPTRQSWGLLCDPVPIGDDPDNDAFAIIPIELDWKTVGGVAYDNPDTQVRITHFPVIHNRRGSVGHRLAWTPPPGRPNP